MQSVAIPEYERFDAITREAIAAFNVPISTITLLDEGRERYISCQGLTISEAPREVSFCAHAMLSEYVFIVEDTLRDPRFSDNPMVTGEPHIRFYAGVSIRGDDNMPLGVFCIKDTKPCKLSAESVGLLLEFAYRVSVELTKSGETTYPQPSVNIN